MYFRNFANMIKCYPVHYLASQMFMHWAWVKPEGLVWIRHCIEYCVLTQEMNVLWVGHSLTNFVCPVNVTLHCIMLMSNASAVVIHSAQQREFVARLAVDDVVECAISAIVGFMTNIWPPYTGKENCFEIPLRRVANQNLNPYTL